jgi:hypothetical protein
VSKQLIISVDPGKATGVAVFQFVKGEEPIMLESAEVDFYSFAPWVREWLAYYFAGEGGESEVRIVCERFTINAQTVKNSQAPFSLEEIGVLKQIMLDYNLNPDTLKFQSPADAKAMFDNSKLKKLEYWYRGGEGHALDAIRHGLLLMVKLGWSPLNRLRN